VTDPVRDTVAESRTYSLGHSERELERLSIQARLIEPITRRYFSEAGIGPGMRVLDVGSGAGDVAFLVADLVGASGEVVGADRVATALDTARQRARDRSLSNVTFVEGDPAKMTFGVPFDAVVGRYILMYQPDPAATLRKLVSHLRPGGVVVFHEPYRDGLRSFPPVPEYDRGGNWSTKRSAARARIRSWESSSTPPSSPPDWHHRRCEWNRSSQVERPARIMFTSRWTSSKRSRQRWNVSASRLPMMSAPTRSWNAS
jgi:SAM-dependent methyltransferase